MKHIKQIIAAVIAVTLVAALLPQIFPAKAATNGVQIKLDELKAVYDTGTYFTADGNACYSDQNDNCRLSRIPSRGGLPSGAEVYAQLRSESWSCRSFANYAFYYIFGEAYWDLKSTDSPVLGDFILLNNGRHSAIYLSEDANYYYVYDSNGNSTNVVYYGRAFSKLSWKISGAYHAASYDNVMNGAGAIAVVKEPADGKYFVSSVQSGLYISSASPAEGKAICALTDVHRDTLTAQVKKADGAVTLSIPAGLAKDVNWVLEAAVGGYVIRSASEPSRVLTANEDNTVTLTEYDESAAQLWKLETEHHNLFVKSTTAATCTARGETVFACSDCDYAYSEYEEQLPHVYTVETVEPGETTYGFTKFKCATCGQVLREDIQEKLNADALVDTGAVLQMSSGFVYITTDVTEEDLLDAFPGYEASGSPATCTGKMLVPKGVDSVPDRDILTVILPGDVDKDGKVTAGDARLVLRACVSLNLLEDAPEKLAADVDFDGRITVEDARWLLRTTVGYETGATTLAGIDAG